MKGHSTLVLFVCIVVLGLLIWFQESYRAHTPSRESKRLKIFDLDPATLTSVQFDTANSVIKCVKDKKGVWLVGDPERGMGRADVALVYRMVSGLDSIGKGTTITATQLERRGLDASEYGLDPPTIEITAVDNKGSRRWIIGRKAPLGDMVYLKEEGSDDIFTVPTLLLSIIPSNSGLLRDRVLFPGEPASTRRIEIRGPSGFIRIVKEPTSGWRLQQPVVAQADPLEVSTYLDKLYRIRIDDFVADNVSDLSVYGLQGETKQISLASADGSSRMLVIGDEMAERPGFVYARRADDTSVFSMTADVLQLLDVPVNSFRDARVIPMAKSDITSILIRKGPEQLAMSMNAAGEWKITIPVAWNADADAVANFLSLWDHIVITDFDVSINTTSTAEWVLEFGSNKTSATNRVEVLPASGRKDGLLVRRDEGSSVFQINLPEVPNSIINPLIYKDKHVWNIRKNQINKLTLSRANHPRQSVEFGNDGSSIVSEPIGSFQVDSFAVGKVLDALSSLQTSGYITYNPRNLDIYGLANPSVELYVGLVNSNELGRVLQIGNESTDGYYSMVKGRDVVFYLDKPTVKVLSADLITEPKASASPNE